MSIKFDLPAMELATSSANRPLNLAHRGARAFAPENTLAAFELALQQGADGFECDLHLSADGEVVVVQVPRARHSVVTGLTSVRRGSLWSGTELYVVGLIMTDWCW